MMRTKTLARFGFIDHSRGLIDGGLIRLGRSDHSVDWDVVHRVFAVMGLHHAPFFVDQHIDRNRRHLRRRQCSGEISLERRGHERQRRAHGAPHEPAEGFDHTMPLKVLVCFVSHKEKWDLTTTHTFPQLLDVGVEHTDHHRVIWKLIPSLDEPVNADVAKRTGSESKNVKMTLRPRNSSKEMFRPSTDGSENEGAMSPG